jgi:hypothetical protein
VQAGAILMHDFALTEDEAWPLLVEWNETRTAALRDRGRAARRSCAAG